MKNKLKETVSGLADLLNAYGNSYLSVFFY